MWRTVLACVRAGVPALLIGQPGVGKTAKIRSYFGHHDFHVEVVSGGNREASDFLGLPVERNGAVEYAPLGWAIRCNQARKAVAFLDEMGENEASFSAMLRVLQDRAVGDMPLGDHVALLAAMNPADISVSGLHLPGPIANRMVHLDWQFDQDEWAAGLLRGFVGTSLAAPEQYLPVQGAATYATVAGRVAAYLRSDPAALAPKPPESEAKRGGAWPSPRSWHNAVRVLAQLPTTDDDAIHLTLCGTVGEAAAIKFERWSLENDLYDLPSVLSGAVKVNWTERGDRLFALTNGLASYGLTDPNMWTKAIQVLADGAAVRPDTVYPAALDLLRAIPPGQRLPKTAQTAFAEILAKIGLVLV